MTKAKFVRGANVICRHDREDRFTQIAAYLGRNAVPGTSEEILFTKLTRRLLLPAIEREVARVRELVPPARDQARIETILDAQQKVVHEVARLPRVASRFEVERHFANAAALARSYSLGACANAPTPRS